jgi:hypothetical protein
MKYKVGEKVRVRTNFTRKECERVGYVKEFENYKGKIVTITKRHKRDTPFNKPYEDYRIKEDDNEFSWDGIMFMPLFQNEEEAFSALIKGEITSKDFDLYTSTTLL